MANSSRGPAHGRCRQLTRRRKLVVLALPYAAVEPVVSELGPLAGKILIDATNPVADTDHGPDLALGFTDSAAEALARQVPQARVVKTLNQVGAEVMLDTTGFAHPPEPRLEV